MERLQRQMSTLRESRAEVEADVRANEELGARVRTSLSEKLAGRGRGSGSASGAGERFDVYVGELDRVLRLHHRVSSRLERVNGALDALREDASPSERVCPVLLCLYTFTYIFHLSYIRAASTSFTDNSSSELSGGHQPRGYAKVIDSPSLYASCLSESLLHFFESYSSALLTCC